MSKEREWLQSLSAGDEAFLRARFGGVAYPVKVMRTTPTQIIIEVETGLAAIEEKFRRNDGRSVSGDVWSRSYLEETTQELRDAFELAQLIAKAKRLKEGIVIPKTKPELIKFIEALKIFSPTSPENPQ
jgi:hypothetical protein